jgi:predicted MPP superfamily phosphohydrolase
MSFAWRALRTLKPSSWPAALAALLLAWGFLIEPRWLAFREIPVSWNGPAVRVGLLSDLHFGSPGGPTTAAIDALNEARPDVIVLLGDYVIHGVVGGRFIEPEKIAAQLARLKAPLGVYAVLGNHDWWHGGEKVRAALEKAGIKVLENETADLGPFRLAGLADEWTRGPDAAKVLKKTGKPVLAAIHGPDIFPDLPAGFALVVAGHTHGGQVRLPFIGSPLVPSRYGQRYAAGLIEENGRKLFVTVGVGTSILPLRFGVRPEAVVLSLRP